MRKTIICVFLLLIFILGCQQPVEETETINEEAYRSEVSFNPTSPGGSAGYIFIQLKDPQGRPVQGFTEGEERSLNIFVLSQDLSYFLHNSLADFSSIGEEDLGNAFFKMGTTFPIDGNYLFIVEHNNNTNSVREDFWITSGGLGIPQAEQPEKNFSQVQKSGDYTVMFNVDKQAKAGEETAFLVSVTKNSVPLVDLEPYQEKEMHVTVIKDALTGFARLYPIAKEGNNQAFLYAFPEAGDYKFYVEFKDEGKIMTTEFWASVG